LADETYAPETDAGFGTYMAATGEAVIRLEDRDGGRTLTVDGEIDVTNSGTLDEVLRRALHNALELVIDLRGLRFVDSSGIRSLVAGARHASANGCELVVRRPRSEAWRVLELTGLKSVLRFVD
jgi:anti-sigma B factor antagonist